MMKSNNEERTLLWLNNRPRAEPPRQRGGFRFSLSSCSIKQNQSTMKPYRRTKSREAKWLERILSSWELSPEHVATSKRKFIYFLRSYPVKDWCFDSRRLVVKALFGNLDSNTFWTEVFHQVFDDRSERREFRRAILRVIDDVSDKRVSLCRSCVSRSLAWPMDPLRARPACHIQAMPVWMFQEQEENHHSYIMQRIKLSVGDERFVYLEAAA